MNANEIVRALKNDAKWVKKISWANALTPGSAEFLAVSERITGAADLIESLQAQLNDAVPVVRGEWIVTDAYPHRVYCSLCYKTNVPNEEWLYEKNDYPKYCMWCGAKMEDKP